MSQPSTTGPSAIADEDLFIQLLVANERIGRAVDTLMDPFMRSK